MDSFRPCHCQARGARVIGSQERLVKDVVQSLVDNDLVSKDNIATTAISGLLLVPLTLALTIFMFWHVYLILQNKTTIEHLEGMRAMWLAKKRGYLYSHPYDLGAYENMISVLGPNTFCWVCPTSEQIGSGLHFCAGVDKLVGISF